MLWAPRSRVSVPGLEDGGSETSVHGPGTLVVVQALRPLSRDSESSSGDSGSCYRDSRSGPRDSESPPLGHGTESQGSRSWSRDGESRSLGLGSQSPGLWSQTPNSIHGGGTATHRHGTADQPSRDPESRPRRSRSWSRDSVSTARHQRHGPGLPRCCPLTLLSSSATVEWSPRTLCLISRRPAPHGGGVPAACIPPRLLLKLNRDPRARVERTSSRVRA